MVDFFKSHCKFLGSGNINYSKEPQIVDTFEKNESQVIKIFFNKQSEWFYEKEFRVLMRCKQSTEFININQNYIKAVYIGSKCKKEIADEVISICKGKNVKVYHAITMSKNYKIEFEEHNDKTTYMKSFW